MKTQVFCFSKRKKKRRRAMKSPLRMLKVNNRYVELNKVDRWLDQPVGKPEKIFLLVMAILVVVSILIMIAKWI
jgi:hypothetical protein